MLKLYHTDAKSVHGQLKKVIAPYICGNSDILRTPNGKPYIEGNPVYFSISHSHGKAVIALYDEPVGADLEIFTDRKYKSILSRFSLREQAVIHGNFTKFLENWTVKEAFVKMIGGRIFSYITRLEYLSGVLYLDNIPQNCGIYTHLFNYGIISVCTEKNNEKQFENIFL